MCLEGRKVFLAEQELYAKASLERHMRQGDTEGSLAQSGFKGHPFCKWCRKYFYGDNEMYTHMHSSHEECFICRRANPGKYEYFRDYEQLEAHFSQKHYPCMHPSCREKKFVVFPMETDLRKHTAKEHPETLSKAERKQALSVPVGFTYRRTVDGGETIGTTAAATPTAIAAGMSGITIGPTMTRSRLGRNSQNHLAEEEPQSLAPNVSQQAPLNGGGSDFPVVGQTPDESATLGGTASGGRWIGAATSGSSFGALQSADQFPALPGTSKSAKKRAAEKKKKAGRSMADTVRPEQVRREGPAPSTPAEHFPSLLSSAIPRNASSQEVSGPSAGFTDDTLPAGPSVVGVSEALRSANRTLVQRIKNRLTASQFENFKSLSSSWLKGNTDSQTYHQSIGNLGLAGVVPDLAATCPDGIRREELLTIHKNAFSSGEHAKGWVPPEAAEAAVRHAESNSSWSCSVCTLLNAPGARTCEACGQPRKTADIGQWGAGNGSAPQDTSNTMKAAPLELFPMLPTGSGNSRNAGGNSVAPSSGVGKIADTKKKGKQTVGLGEFYSKTKSHTQNPWKNPNRKGDWAKNGALAQEERALKGAWEKK